MPCLARFAFDDGRPHERVRVAGEFNGWSESADRLEPAPERSPTAWVLERPLPAGAFAYHYLVDGVPALDPLNHRRTYRTGEERSLLVFDGCEVPRVEVRRFEVHADGALLARATFVPARDGATLDAEASEVSVDGSPLPAALWSVPDGPSLRVEVRGLPLGKHTLTLALRDTAGRAAPPLRLSGWVEAEPFTWEGALLYFPLTDRFRNGDPSNDAPLGVEWPAEVQGGDLAGILSALEDGTFEALGVTALWLSPLPAGPARAYPGTDGHLYAGYHGYWPARPRTVEPRFGDLETLQAVVAAAHARGIRVLGDLVFNHVHEEHPYASRPGWIRGDGSCVCGQSPGCGWDEAPLTCWFTSYLPDVDWTFDEAADAMVADALWWLDTADLDGFRVDAVKHFEARALADLRAALAPREAAGGAHVLLLGETFVGEGDRAPLLAEQGPAGLDGHFDFPLYWTLLRVFARDEGTFLDLDAAVRAGEATWPAGVVMSPFLGNHDVPRLISEAAGDIADLYGTGARAQGWSDPPGAPVTAEPYERAALAFAFLLTSPGMPLLYYGDEVGLPGAGDPDNRRFMPAEADLTGAQRALREEVRRLGRLRRESRALRLGERRTLLVEPDHYAYVRDAGGAEVAVVVLNRGAVAARLAVPLDGALAGVPRLTFDERLEGGQVVALDGVLQVTLPPRSARVYFPAR